jgi:hypothetical protein
VNLVRLGDLDLPLGPGRSLLDDTRDDTQALDPIALAKLDHLIAALEARGIFVALELLSQRRFRTEDRVAASGLLPPGGGPATLFDPRIRQLTLETARALLGHVNPETGRALRDDPALAWVTLTGEVSLFNLIDNPQALPAQYNNELRSLAGQTSGGGSGRRLWELVESEYGQHMADALRKDGLRVPVAGVSHPRREREFVQAQRGPGLDLIDDRIYWSAPAWLSPEYRSMLWSVEGGLLTLANHKRRADRPYVVGHWCNQTLGAWGLPYEAADELLGVYTATIEDWDALVRRGVYVFPLTWGEGPAGTVGGEDIFQVAAVVNGSPHLYALWPHAASLWYRGQGTVPIGRPPVRGRRQPLPGWEPSRGRWIVDTPYTQGLIGASGGEPVRCTNLDFSTDNPFVVLVASSISSQPIATTKRLLISAVARVEPTGFRWVDPWKYRVADPGRPPFLQEPVTARVLWRRKGAVKAFALNNAGERTSAARLEVLPDGPGVALTIDGKVPAFHWELIVE